MLLEETTYGGYAMATNPNPPAGTPAPAGGPAPGPTGPTQPAAPAPTATPTPATPAAGAPTPTAAPAPTATPTQPTPPPAGPARPATPAPAQLPQPDRQPDEDEGGGTKWGMVLIAGVLAALLLGYIFFFQGDDESGTDSAVNAESTQVTPKDSTKLGEKTADSHKATPPASQVPSMFGITGGFKPTAAQVESLARMEPANLLERIQQLKAEKMLWDFRTEGTQKATGDLHRAAMSLTGQIVTENPLGGALSGSLVGGDNFDRLEKKVDKIDQNLAAFRRNSGANWEKSVQDRKKIMEGVSNVEADMVAARGELACLVSKLKEELAGSRDPDAIERLTEEVRQHRLKVEEIIKKGESQKKGEVDKRHRFF
ncbi:TPA: hypothetical protein DEB72_02770 [Patescibacteria group bacterium]|nr:hypothetical protein [Patescibacteria group bacterium]